MNAAVELVSSFRRKGVRFAVEGDQLRYWAPAGSLSAADLGSLKALKRDIISLLEEAAVRKPELRPAARADELLPSWEQLGWWDGIRRGLYTQPYWLQLTAVLRWRGVLECPVLERALTTMVARHEIMRTRFLDCDGRPVMVIDAPAPVRVELHDLSHLPASEREPAARALATEISQRLFESLAVPLLRTHLLRLAGDDHVFIGTVHHIITDAQSMDTLRNELHVLYADFAAGRTPTLAPPRFQYTDYSAWQRSWMTLERQQAYLARLKNRVAGPLRFPTDPAAALTQTATRLVRKQWLAADLVSSLQELARSAGTTRHLVVLTALKIVLAEWTHQAQVTVASVGNLRIHEGLMDMLGPFACLDLVSTNLANARTFREALSAVIESYAEAQDFRPYAPGSEYVPLVNVFVDYIRDFSLDAGPVPAVPRAADAPALQTEEFPLLPVADSAMRQWALLIVAKEQAGAIEVEISCSSGQFSESTVQRAFERLQSILAACVRDDTAASLAITADALQTV